MNPVVLKVSSESSYKEDMYCKWLIKSSDDSVGLVVEMLEVDVYPVADRCMYDGLVIYDGPTSDYPVLGESLVLCIFW
jgi:hypothetical protein